MRDLSIKILENYLASCNNKEKFELRDIIEQEKLGGVGRIEVDESISLLG